MELRMDVRTSSLRIPSVEKSSYEEVLARMGSTPLLRVRRVSSHLPETVELWAKAEWNNPTGSVKDRPAAFILRQALARGDLGRGQTLLDSTSGNMGIAYASFCAALGIPVHLMVPANASPERLALLRLLGARLTLTDPLEGTDGAREAAAREAVLHPQRYFYADQYSNPANWQAHYETTGPEILEQTDGRLTHLVAGLGTTGTLTGVGRLLRDAGHPARLIAVQPDGPLHGLEGLKHLETSPVPLIFDPTLPDATIIVRTEDAHQMARRLAAEEGLLVGVSAAAAIVASLRVAESLERGLIVAILPDSAFKYLSERFWSEG
jgi:cysteine synthase B